MRGHNSADSRFKVLVYITIHVKAEGVSFLPATNWSELTTLKLKPACLGDEREDFEAQLCISETEEYRGEVFHVYKKCCCGRHCVLRINRWCDENTVILPNVPTLIGEFEVGGFHLDEGMGHLEFEDPFIVTTSGGATSSTMISSDTATSVKVGNGQIRIEGISVEYVRVP